MKLPKWSPGKLYEITLNSPHPEAVLYGFKNGRQERLFKNKRAKEDFEGEMWSYGITDITIKEIKSE
jgi:hypothetical protein